MTEDMVFVASALANGKAVAEVERLLRAFDDAPDDTEIDLGPVRHGRSDRDGQTEGVPVVRPPRAS